MAQETGKEKGALDVPEAIDAQDVQQEQNDTAGPEATEEKLPDGMTVIEEFMNAAGEKAKTPKTPEEITARAQFLEFYIDFMRNPEDALLSHATQGTAKFYPEWIQSQYYKLVQQVAEETGTDPEQIADKDKRTPEQDGALTEAAARAQIARIEAFVNTNYVQALAALTPLKVTARTITDPEEVGIINKAAVLYFFARHWPKVRPDGRRTLTEKQLDEIKNILSRFDKFIDERPAAPISEHFAAFIEEDSENPEEIKKNIPKITGGTPDKYILPTDKVNKSVWDWDQLSQRKTINGHYYLSVDSKRKDVLIEYGISWEAIEEAEKNGEITITKHLDLFDKRVYIAVYNLYRNYGVSITTAQIFHAMGYEDKVRPNAKILERINDSLNKMRAASIYINNSRENAAHPNKEMIDIDDASLLAFKRRSVLIHNKLCNSAIVLLLDPTSGKPLFPLMDFAVDRNEITTVPRKVLTTPISKTEKNIALEEYVRGLIVWMKYSSAAPRKILLTTIYEKCGIETTMQKRRAPDTIDRLLQYYKTIEFIKGYRSNKKSITIELFEDEEEAKEGKTKGKKGKSAKDTKKN